MTKPPRPPGALPPQPWSVPTGGTRPEIHDKNGRVICRMADTSDAMEVAATTMCFAPALLTELERVTGIAKKALAAGLVDAETIKNTFQSTTTLIAKARGQ